MVDYFAADKTGCVLEKSIPAKGCNKKRAPFYFSVEVLLLLLLPLRSAAAAHNNSTEARRGIPFPFLTAALLLLFNHREGGAEKIRLGSGFCSIRVRTQSRPL